MQDICARSGGFTFVALLKDCAKRKDLKRGSEIHAEIMNMGILSKDLFVGSALVAMYVKCAELAKAQEVFDQLPIRTVVPWNALITGYTSHGHSEKVLYLLEKMQLDGVSPSSITFICCLKACAAIDAIDKGTELHAEMARKGLLLESSNLCCALVDMYVKCGFCERAQEVLNMGFVCNVDAWNAMIWGYLKGMHCNQALRCYEQMQLKGTLPDAITYAGILKACGSVRHAEAGTRLHVEIITKGLLETDMLLGSSLLDMYLKCGLLEEAHAVFNGLLVRDAVAWTTLIGGYVDHDHAVEGLKFLRQMHFEGLSADSITFLYGLKACATIGAVADGREMHSEVEKRGFSLTDASVPHAVVDMYCKCGLFVEASEVFSRLQRQDVVLWNVLIAGHVDYGLSEEALDCLDHMQYEGVAPDAITLACCLKACGNIGATDTGRRLHAKVEYKGLLEGHLAVGNALIDMYGKCGSMYEAHEVLKKLPFRDRVSWNALISGYADLKRGGEAIDCFKQMQAEGVSPNVITFSSILKACGSIQAADCGMDVHSELVARGLLNEGRFVPVGGMVIDLYANCGFLEEAKNVFEKLPIQSSLAGKTLLSAYVEQGLENEAFQLFDQMQLEGTVSDQVTLICSLKACSSVGARDKGLAVHAEIERLGFSLRNSIGTALVDMYMKFSLLAKAREVFDKLSVRDILAWNALICGFAKHGFGEDAFECFQQMQLEGALPDTVTFIGIYKACGVVKAIAKGREMHAAVSRQSLCERDLVVSNALLDMYVNCGWFEGAHGVLEELPVRNTVSWNTLIAAYTRLKHGEQALICFELMQLEGILPDAVTLACSLRACCYLKALSKGREIHADAVRKGLMNRHSLVGNALVDMYARHGCVLDARKVFQTLPNRDVISWNTMLTGFLICNQGDEALKCFKQMQLEGVSWDAISFVCGLKACSSIGALEIGQEIHTEIERDSSLDSHSNIGNSLISMYVRCGSLFKAAEVLNSLKERDLVSWNTFIMGHALRGDSENAFQILERMEAGGCEPDSTTSLGIVSACNHEGLADKAEAFFYFIYRDWVVIPTIEHLTCMVDLLGRAGQLDKAATLIRQMPFHPDIVMSCSFLGACRKWGTVELATEAFEHAIVCDERDVAAHVYMFNIFADMATEEETWMW